MSRGQKNLFAKMRPWFPFLLAGEYTLVAPVGKFIGSYRTLSPVAGVSLRKPRDIVVHNFSPADFGGTNFSVPWTTGGADSESIEFFSH